MTNSLQVYAVFCKKGCRSNQRAIQCDECDSWYHAKCIDMTKREYKNLTDPSSSWICMTCICPLSAYSFDRSKSIDNTDQTMDTCKTSFNGEPEIRMLRGFKIAHLNINRIVNKLDHVKELVQKYSFDILTLSETWLTPNIMDNEISIPGYVLVRKDRQSLSKTCAEESGSIYAKEFPLLLIPILSTTTSNFYGWKSGGLNVNE